MQDASLAPPAAGAAALWSIGRPGAASDFPEHRLQLLPVAPHGALAARDGVRPAAAGALQGVAVCGAPAVAAEALRGRRREDRGRRADLARGR